VYRGAATGALGTKIPIATVLTNPVYNDSAVINGTTYYYQVTAVNANGESGGSNEKSATPAAPSAAPFIRAQVITWTATPPAGYPVLEVEVCTESNCNTPINNATVTINSTALTYTATDQLYQASAPMPALGATVSLSVTIPGGWLVTAGTYTASGTQYTTIPSVTSPTPFAIWNDTVAHGINWTAGSPTTASDYIVGIVDDFGTFYPGNNLVTVPTTTTSYTLPASSTTPGNYAVFVGIGTQGIGTGATGGISITPSAAAGSGLWIGGVSSIVPITVN
jgi:hypothetical protein